jgi:hypothetical protein
MPFFVIHHKIKSLAIRKGASAALSWSRAGWSTLKDTESTIEAILPVTCLEPGVVAKLGYSRVANHERVINSIGEHCACTRRGKDICGKDGASRIFQAGEREHIGEIRCGIADLPWSIYVV